MSDREPLMRGFDYSKLQRKLGEIRRLAAAAESDLVGPTTDILAASPGVKLAKVVVAIEMEDGEQHLTTFHMDPRSFQISQHRPSPVPLDAEIPGHQPTTLHIHGKFTKYIRG